MIDLRDKLALRVRQAGLPVPPWLTDWGAKPTPLNTVASFNELTARLETIGRGEAVVAHLLLPHFPYALGDDCSVKPYEAWQQRKSDQPIDDRLRAYADQVKCTNILVSKLIRAVGPEAIIVIHGDHGPRIVKTDPYSSNKPGISQDQFASGYSTMFAVRIPGQPTGVERAQKPVSAMLIELADAKWQKLPDRPAPKRPTVMLNDERSYPTVEAQLPDWNAPASKDSPSR